MTMPGRTDQREYGHDGFVFKEQDWRKDDGPYAGTTVSVYRHGEFIFETWNIDKAKDIARAFKSADLKGGEEYAWDKYGKDIETMRQVDKETSSLEVFRVRVGPYHVRYVRGFDVDMTDLGGHCEIWRKQDKGDPFFTMHCPPGVVIRTVESLCGLRAA